MKYPIMEIFESIQGEGSMIGMPVTFIRMKGCNLACPWCDTKESWKKPSENEGLTSEEIVEKVTQHIVVITGGEPCLYDLEELISVLQGAHHFVCIETNGTLPTPEMADWVVASPKPPEYLIQEKCFFNELKYVLDDNFDLDCIPEDKKEIMGAIWLQPCDYGPVTEKHPDAYLKTQASYKRAAELPLKYPFLRTGIQLHKILDVK